MAQQCNPIKKKKKLKKSHKRDFFVLLSVFCERSLVFGSGYRDEQDMDCEEGDTSSWPQWLIHVERLVGVK